MTMRRFLVACLALAPSITAAFDAEAFRRNENPAWCGLPVLGLFCGDPRAGMWNEVEAALSPGMGRDEVLDLLGPPDFERGGALFYDMGRTGIDPDYLGVHFDAAGRLTGTTFERG